MQVCNKCGKEIKYIAGSYDKVYTCEAQETEFVTANGHKLTGYSIHICKAVDIKKDNKHE